MRKAAEEAALIRKGKLDLLRRKDAGYRCPGHRNLKARRHCERPKSEAHPPDRPISRHMLLADRFSCAVWWNEIGGISRFGGPLSKVDRQVDQGRLVARFRTDHSASAPPIFALIDHDQTSKTCRKNKNSPEWASRQTPSFW